MDDFNIMLGMDFLLKHKFILMPLVKGLVVTRFNSTIIQTITHKLKEVKMMSALQMRRDLPMMNPRSLSLPWLKRGA